MSNVRFTGTKLANTNKKGILKPDEDGYYEMIIGGLNTFNSAGEYYTLEGAKALFEESSIFMRRVRNSSLYAEYAHPKKLPNMSMDQYINRILSIDENNVCCHIKEVWLDETYGKKHPELNNPALVAIMAKVKPYGPKGVHLKESIENPSQNTSFSIRALTNDFYQRGQTVRVLQQIVTFDACVSEPGIAIATKFQSPGLESSSDFSDFTVTRAQIERVAYQNNSFVGTEDSKLLVKECLKAFEVKQAPKPIYHSW